MKLDALAGPKNSKHLFLNGIENSFHEVTHMGLEAHHFFLFLSQQIRSLKTFKVLAEMGRSWHAD